jgi:hypothetical protein
VGVHFFNRRKSTSRPPITLGRGKTHVVTYADILRDLEPLNEGRDESARITYDSLWVHAKRHYGLAGIAAYMTASGSTPRGITALPG